MKNIFIKKAFTCLLVFIIILTGTDVYSLESKINNSVYISSKDKIDSNKEREKLVSVNEQMESYYYYPDYGGEVVHIPDVNLKKAISYRLYGESDRDIYKYDLENMYDLDLTYTYEDRVKNLTGLEYATNLNRLIIMDCEISDFTPITQLNRLIEIQISNDAYDANWELLGNISNLEKLEIRSGNINNTDFINQLTNIKELYLGYIYCVSDLGLEVNNNLTNLEKLTLEGMGISDFDFIKKFDNLKELRIRFNYNYKDFKNLDSISELKQLESLEFTCDYLDDISFISNMVNLKKLDLSNNNVKDIDPIKNLNNLEELSIYSNNIEDISPIKELTMLNSLDIDNNNISNLNGLENLTLLTWLSASKNKIENISSLDKLVNMQYLYLDNNNINNIEALSNMEQLVTVWLNNNKITDISPLGNKTDISWIRIDDNCITDFSSINDMCDVDASNQLLVIPENYISQNKELIIELPKLLNVDGTSLNISIASKPTNSNCSISEGKLLISNIEDNGQIVINFNGKGISGQIIYQLILRKDTLPNISANDIEINRKDIFDPLEGVTAMDDEDGNITSSIEIIENNVDIMKSGEYKVIYKVADSDGNAVTKEIKVVVKAQEVTFGREALKSDVARQLGKTVNDIITDEDMESLEVLYTTSSDLVGLEYATNLKKLEIDETVISDYTPIANLTNLEELYINYYEDSRKTADQLFPMLPKYKNLKKLTLCEVGFKNEHFQYLEELDQLEELSLYYNFMGDISRIPDFQNLKFLDLGCNALDNSDVQELSKLTSLERIYLTRNNIESLSFIKNMINLKEIHITQNKILDLGAIKGFDTIKVWADSSNRYKMPTMNVIDGSLSIENPVIGPDGQKLIPVRVSGNGICSGNEIKWENIKDNSTLEILYKYKKNDISYSIEVDVPIKILNHAPELIVSDQTIRVGQKLDVLHGVIATDKEDGDITNNIIVVKNDVDINRVGEYEVIYNVTDSYGVTVAKIAIITVNYAKEDINEDEVVDVLDLALVGLNYNKESSDEDWNDNIDINKDEIIDIFDLVLISRLM